MPENGEQRQHHAGIRYAQFRPIPYFNRKHLVSTHEQKCLYGRCGIQLHMPRSSPRISPTGVWVKRQADVRTSCGAYRRLWMSSGPSWPCHGRAIGNTNWGFHLYMRESLWRWDFSMELSHSIEAKFMYNTHTDTHTHTHIPIPLDALGCEELTSWLCRHHSSPKGAQLRADFVPCDFPTGEKESWWVNIWLHQLCRMLLRRLVSPSQLPENCIGGFMISTNREGRRKQMGGEEFWIL